MKKTAKALILTAAVFCGLPFVGKGLTQRGPGMPDLGIALGKASISGTREVGQTITIRPTVANNGPVAVSNVGVVVTFSSRPIPAFSDLPIRSTPGLWIVDQLVIKSLAPGAQVVVSAKPFHIPDGLSWGDYTVTASVDPAKKIAEINENNNQAEAPIFVQAVIDFIDQSPELGFCCHGHGFGNWKSGLTIHIGPYTLQPDPATWKNENVHLMPPCGAVPFAPSYDMGLFFGSTAIARTQANPWGIVFQACVPEQGPAGTPFTLQGAYCAGASQGTKKLELRNWPAYQFIAQVTVTSWTNTAISGVIPNVPPGQYVFAITNGGTLLTFEIYGIDFHVVLFDPDLSKT